jgi:UDP-N-acetylmuramoylalanine--D-glutamate ligase
MNLSFYRDKKILILGLGREGFDSLSFFLSNCPGAEIGIADRIESDKLGPQFRDVMAKNPQIRSFLGKNYLLAINDYDIVVKSPGIPIHIAEIEQAFAQGKITSQTEIFFEQCPGMIIGVTGTKGKSTTSSITYEVLRAAGENVCLLGNIGTPMLSFLEGANDKSIFVCELSAHQLYNLKKSPHIAVLLNIYREHLDYYKDFDEYILAKANIAIFQAKGDILIFNSLNAEVSMIAGKSEGRKIAFNEYSWKYPEKTNLIGSFNLENAKIAAIIGRELGISDEIINRAIAEFKPLENRLEFVGNFNGVDYYNDSLSTIQESAVAAIEGFGGRVQTLIAGGYERNQPFDKLAESILASRIKNLVLFPTTGQRIWEQIQKSAAANGKSARQAEITTFFTESMEEAVLYARKKTIAGNVCLLSAASASFNNFRDYADRGNQFKACVRNLADLKK